MKGEIKYTNVIDTESRHKLQYVIPVEITLDHGIYVYHKYTLHGVKYYDVSFKDRLFDTLDEAKAFHIGRRTHIEAYYEHEKDIKPKHETMKGYAKVVKISTKTRFYVVPVDVLKVKSNGYTLVSYVLHGRRCKAYIRSGLLFKTLRNAKLYYNSRRIGGRSEIAAFYRRNSVKYLLPNLAGIIFAALKKNE